MNLTHGLSGGRNLTRRHPAYNRWQNIRQRTTNPNHPRYKDWGGRRTYLCPAGIFIVAEWRDFARFIEDIGEPPGRRYDLYSIDRINNDGPYAPGNVCWSTAAQQRENQYRAPWPFGVLDEQKDGYQGDDVDAIRSRYSGTIANDSAFAAALDARDWAAADARAYDLATAVSTEYA